MGQSSSMEDPRETPVDDPRQKSDWPTHRQTEAPWKGNPEKDQLDPNRPKTSIWSAGRNPIRTENLLNRQIVAWSFVACLFYSWISWRFLHRA